MPERADDSLDRGFDRANAEFWNELCGSTLARAHGVSDHSVASLAAFDRAYLAFYPYLLNRIGIRSVRGKDVLEVGLGYGTLSQQLVLAGARYMGLDVAAGPVQMVNHRLQSLGLPGRSMQGSMLQAPVADESQDVVISVGCFHHTGSVQRCIDETYRVLRPGGSARIMVYNGLSYRQWLRWPRQTLRLFWSGGSSAANVDADRRRTYDANLAGEAAPETVFIPSGNFGKCSPPIHSSHAERRTAQTLPCSLADSFPENGC
ncbi:MAG: class I SAM-dependent methyltransferase [Thermomicrobiales bacterium]